MPQIQKHVRLQNIEVTHLQGDPLDSVALASIDFTECVPLPYTEVELQPADRPIRSTAKRESRGAGPPKRIAERSLRGHLS